jgi:hypothetical protein
VEDVLVRRSDKGEISIYDRRDKFSASFKDGLWVVGRKFQSYDLEEFTILEDDDEILRILTEARTILNQPLPTK